MNESSSQDVSPHQNQPEQPKGVGMLSLLRERLTWKERLSNTIRQAVENHIGDTINLTFDVEDHFLRRARIELLFKDKLPHYILGEIDKACMTPLPEISTGWAGILAGMGGTSAEQRDHNITVKMLSESGATFFATDGSIYFTPEQGELIKRLTIAEIVGRTAVMGGIMYPTLKSAEMDLQKAGMSRRAFLKTMVGTAASAAILAAKPRVIADWVSEQLEKNPDFISRAEGVVRFRNYIMVHSSWNVLQRIAGAQNFAPALFTVARGHNLGGGEGCADLFIKGPEHTENKVRDYARILIAKILERYSSNEVRNSPDSIIQNDALYSLYATLFSLPYQIGPDLPEGKRPTQEFKVPLVLLLEEIGASIAGSSTPEEKVTLSRIICRVIRSVSLDYTALRQFQKPLISLNQTQADETYQHFWLDQPVFSNTSGSNSPRVGFRIARNMLAEINDEYLTSFRFFGNEYKYQYCGFAIQDGLPYPMLEVLPKQGLSSETDNPYAGRLFAEMRDGTLTEAMQ